jgi:hypothetical protein
MQNGSVLFFQPYMTKAETDQPRVLYSYWKPESARTHPEATVRPWATVRVVGDALSFASALGYMQVPLCHLLEIAYAECSPAKEHKYSNGVMSFVVGG